MALGTPQACRQLYKSFPSSRQAPFLSSKAYCWQTWQPEAGFSHFQTLDCPMATSRAESCLHGNLPWRKRQSALPGCRPSPAQGLQQVSKAGTVHIALPPWHLHDASTAPSHPAFHANVLHCGWKGSCAKPVCLNMQVGGKSQTGIV